MALVKYIIALPVNIMLLSSLGMHHRKENEKVVI